MLFIIIDNGTGTHNGEWINFQAEFSESKINQNEQEL